MNRTVRLRDRPGVTWGWFQKQNFKINSLVPVRIILMKIPNIVWGGV